jgi:hypothetical protein
MAHAPERLHDEVSADYKDMIYADTREEIETRRKAFISKWRLKHLAVADSLRKPATGSSPVCRRTNGAACAPRMRSNGHPRRGTDRVRHIICERVLDSAHK